MEGTVYFTENGQPYELKQGEWFIQTPGLLHYGHAASSERAAYYWIHFMPTGRWDIRNDRLVAQGAGAYRVQDSGDGIRIPEYEFSVAMRHRSFPIDLWKLELEDLSSPMVNRNPLMAQSRLLKLLSDMQHLVDIVHPLSAGQRLAQRVYDYLHQHYLDTITVEQLSHLFHFSADYLTKCFRAKYGVPPIVYWIGLRMEHAKNQLISTSRPIREIAAEVGYEDLSVFSRAFKNDQGISPSLYRSRAIRTQPAPSYPESSDLIP